MVSTYLLSPGSSCHKWEPVYPFLLASRWKSVLAEKESIGPICALERYSEPPWMLFMNSRTCSLASLGLRDCRSYALPQLPPPHRPPQPSTPPLPPPTPIIPFTTSPPPPPIPPQLITRPRLQTPQPLSPQPLFQQIEPTVPQVLPPTPQQSSKLRQPLMPLQ